MEQNQGVPVAQQPAASAIADALAQSEPVQPALMQAAPAPKKKSSAVALSIVLLVILALGGIGFGVWAFISKGQEVDRLNKQIEMIKSSQTVLNPTSDDNSDDDTTTAVIDTTEYIYVGEWGIKIKIPENLANVSYKVRSFDNGDYAGTSLCVSGATTGHEGTPTFIVEGVQSNYLYCLSKNTKSSSDTEAFWAAQKPVGEFYTEGPQALIGDGSDQAWETESVQAVKVMLETESNRSTI